MAMQTPSMDALFESRLAFPNRRQGKVRDIYDLPPGVVAGLGRGVLLVASDRISAFDVVLPTPIPGKGRILTSMAKGWFDLLRKHSIVKDHLVSTEVPPLAPADAHLHGALNGRVMVCRAAAVVPIECVVRGYLTGSGWVEYQQSSSVCGVKLPAGIAQCAQLPEPIFTPATKESTGHDENISFDRACQLVGGELTDRLRHISLSIYRVAAQHALQHGLILADTKFEFGFALDSAGKPTDELMIVDEVLTPDSSRYWPLDGYRPGNDQPSFDKQYLRNWLLALCKDGKWNKTPPGPVVPSEIVAGTLARYEEALTKLFG